METTSSTLWSEAVCLWIVPTILGGLLAITLLGRFAATASHHSLEAAKEKFESLKPRGLAARIREAAGGGSSYGTGHDDDRIIPVSDEPASRASTAIYGDKDADKSEYDGSCTEAAARTACFLSLVIATVGSLLIEYGCQRGYTGVVPNCTLCVNYAAQMSLVILAGVWIVHDVAHRSSVTGDYLILVAVSWLGYRKA
ncbi:hypothetical protein HDU87_003117 [Geranomyces variabilis]|uniref:Uncharacterized protein n=1 Tax=Geranomyces variabilis TaxID=109894 RepID=A0AAD5XMW5_9FUNG|nr:hypothetical protein HDU87_003117 [Geranomyces variabilis]